MAADERPKMKPCRNCKADVPEGEACEACGWDESKARARVIQRKLEGEIAKEIEDETKGKKKTKRSMFNF